MRSQALQLIFEQKASAQLVAYLSPHTRGTHKMGSQSIRRPNPVLPDSIFQMFRLDKKVVIITGGAGGIGYQVARGLAEAGANIALWYHGSSHADRLASELEKDFGIKAKAYKCSVQNFENV